MTVAGWHMRNTVREQVLHLGAMLDEAYLRLFDGSQLRESHHAHFKAIASSILRRILVDNESTGRGSSLPVAAPLVKLQVSPSCIMDVPSLAALDAAMQELAKLNRRQAEIVQYRVFGALPCDEIARLRGIPQQEAANDWDFARAWLRMRLPVPQSSDDMLGSTGDAL
jgi:RNA polymerase sigma factor (TIGR02999 family)